jgi:fluoroacetyl-CoA thioesterase
MKVIFKPGDSKTYQKTVTENDTATFHGEILHRVYATFALARDFEWSSRLFFLEMKDDDEEGVGTFLQIEHKSPAQIGEEVTIKASIESITGNELICIIEARSGNRIIATGKTGQKMLKKEKLKKLSGHG